MFRSICRPFFGAGFVRAGAWVLAVGAVLEGCGLATITLPPWLLTLAYAAIGWTIGGRFSRPILHHVAHLLPRLLASTLALIALCGGVAAALDPASRLTDSDFIGAWVADLKTLDERTPAVPSDAGEGRQLRIEHLSVEQSLEHLRTFPWIAERERAGRLTLHGAWFDISLGELHALSGGNWLPQPYDGAR